MHSASPNPRAEDATTPRLTAGADYALAQASTLASPDELDRLDALRDRWSETRLRVLVVGEAKRGKSTLVNALLDRPVLPTGVTPLTSVATTVRATTTGEAEHVEVWTAGKRQRRPLDALAAYVTETCNPHNRKQVSAVIVALEGTDLTPVPVELIDSPGLGSVYAHNTDEARRAIQTLDAAILVLAVDPPITAAERDLLMQLREGAQRVFLVVNKTDRHTGDEVRQSVGFTQQTSGGVLTDPVPIYAISAAHATRDPGFVEFRQELNAYLHARAHGDAVRSLTRQTTAMLTAMRDHRATEHAALELTLQGDQRKVEELKTRLDVIADQRQELASRIAAGAHRLRARLDRAAEEAVRPIVAAGRRELDMLWSSPDGSRSLTELEEVARRKIQDCLQATVDGWRLDVAHDLEAGLAQMVQRTQEDLQAQLALVRSALHDVLGLEIATEATIPQLPASHRFRYDFSTGASWDPPLPGLTRVMRTPASRRRQLRRTLDRSVASLAERQVGRARADLQQRLLAATRQLTADLNRSLSGTVDYVTRAVASASADATTPQRRARVEQLGAEQAAVEQLVRVFEPSPETSAQGSS